ncbi:MAG: hypothetical protein RR404_02735 [Bacilli bacterium]
MRKYHLFIIRSDFKESYYKNSKVLYQTLFNLYKLKSEDCRIGVSIFHQICNLFNPDLLINYIKEKYKLKSKKNHYFLINNEERTFVNFNYSCTIIYTNKNIPFIFKILYLYNKNVFIVDFENEDYFWLRKETFK